jgi:hypothetical protein
MILGSEIREKLARNSELKKMERDVLSEAFRTQFEPSSTPQQKL